MVAAYIVIKFVWTPGGWQAMYHDDTWQGNLVSPVLSRLPGGKVETTPTPKPTPKQFKFNENTNLEQELESVNPGLNENDFSILKQLTEEI